MTSELNELRKTAKTLKDLKKAGYRTRSVKTEIRQNLIQKLRRKKPVFHGIHGYETTVIPDLQRALLAQHNILLLGLRGQAKTKIARQITELLDEWIPIIKGSEINDDPFHPISRYGKDLLQEYGDDLPIEWKHRSERYVEKLATPDVTVADLIGDLDPIKAANLRLPFSDERVIHFGLIPRANRGIFVINELPDLQPRIQVALFNILQERDIQIRGFSLLLPLDIQFIFTANPEDYTNRGRIITPLKDRIESQILTHYPKDIEIAKKITLQEARILSEQQERIYIPPIAHTLLEQISFEARQSPYVDEKSGVSARLSISAYENLISSAERRLLLNDETHESVRLVDFWGIIPAITGKVELVYEGEKEGHIKVAHLLIQSAIKTLFPSIFPSPEKHRKSEQSPYQNIIRWFQQGNQLELYIDTPYAEYYETLSTVPDLEKLAAHYAQSSNAREILFYMEFILHGLAAYSLLSKYIVEGGMQFRDLLSSMLSFEDDLDAPS